MIHPFKKNIWTSTQKLRFFGIEVGARMTIVDYTGRGDLWIHSPIEPTDALVEALAKLGTVRAVIAPNLWHHFFASSFKKRFPEATLLGAPGLQQKKERLPIDETLEDGKTYTWSSAIQHLVLDGAPRLNEVIFFHPESQTLIVTDLGLHICEESPWLTSLNAAIIWPRPPSFR